MLEKIDLSKKVDKNTFKQVVETEGARLAELQRECKSAGIPVMIVFEGFGAAGKGLQIGKLIQSLDRAGLRYMRSSVNQRRKRCIRSCGDSGQRLRQREGLPYLTEAGTGRS